MSKGPTTVAHMKGLNDTRVTSSKYASEQQPLLGEKENVTPNSFSEQRSILRRGPPRHCDSSRRPFGNSNAINQLPGPPPPPPLIRGPQMIESVTTTQLTPTNFTQCESPIKKKKKSRRPREAQRFPNKLLALTNTCDTGAIGWHSCGDVIFIRLKQFKHEFLDTQNVFKTYNTSSFIRQLNLYGFKKVTNLSVVHSNLSDPEINYFKNPHFIRDKPYLMDKVIRSYTCQRPASQKSERHLNQLQSSPLNEKLENFHRVFDDVLNKQVVSYASKVASHQREAIGSQTPQDNFVPVKMGRKTSLNKENVPHDEATASRRKRRTKAELAAEANIPLSQWEEKHIDHCLRKLDIPSNFNYLFADLNVFSTCTTKTSSIRKKRGRPAHSKPHKAPPATSQTAASSQPPIQSSCSEVLDEEVSPSEYAQANCALSPFGTFDFGQSTFFAPLEGMCDKVTIAKSIYSEIDNYYQVICPPPPLVRAPEFTEFDPSKPCELSDSVDIFEDNFTCTPDISFFID